jgi:hypothetical protein
MRYIFTESQIKKIIDNQLVEQTTSAEKSFNNVYANEPVSTQKRTVKPQMGGKYAFSNKKLAVLDQDKTYKLHLVRQGETVDSIVRNLGGNGTYNILWANDLLQNNPRNLKAGDVIAFSVAKTA